MTNQNISMNKKEELLTLFTIALVLIAASVLVYMYKTPSITGSVTLGGFDSSITITLVSLLILFGIMVIVGAILSIHQLQKELENHKRIATENKTILPTHPNIDIVRYVMNARRNDFSNNQIIEKLKEEGWKKEEIMKYL